jgi:hypothetical protein
VDTLLNQRLVCSKNLQAISAFTSPPLSAASFFLASAKSACTLVSSVFKLAICAYCCGLGGAAHAATEQYGKAGWPCLAAAVTLAKIAWSKPSVPNSA